MSAKFLYFFSIQNEYLLSVSKYLLYLRICTSMQSFSVKRSSFLSSSAQSLIQYWHGRLSSGFHMHPPAFSTLPPWNYTYKSTNFSALSRNYIHIYVHPLYFSPVGHQWVLAKQRMKGKLQFCASIYKMIRSFDTQWAIKWTRR